MISIFASFSSKRVRALAYLSLAAAAFYVQPVRPIMLVGYSMAPSYLDREIVMAVHYTGQELHLGDGVVVRTGGGPIIRRLADLPGESIEQVRSDGWTDDYTPQALRVSKRFGAYRKIVVPEHNVYLRGDNPSVSIDSRQLGSFDFDDVQYVLLNPRPKPSPREVSEWCFKYL